MARFVPDKAGMDFVLRSLDGPVGRDFKKRERRLVSLAKAQVGKDTLALMRSINGNTSLQRTGLVVTVGSNNKIALLHHKGARPHTIAARRASTLRFVSHGRIVYAKVVRHPGTKPNNYLTDNLRKVV